MSDLHTQIDETGKVNSLNVDPNEIDKFQSFAQRWWDPQGDFRPLHEINPLRLNYIEKRVGLPERDVLDVGCGGGILSEGMVHRGARVTGIDMADKPLAIARLHAHEAGLKVDYRHTTIEQLADESDALYDLVTCLEMLEHVPDPASTIKACSRVLKSGGHLVLSTINRNPKSYAFAIIGAEYVLKLLPKGTHDYAKFIKPSELSRWIRQAGLEVNDIRGMSYNPLTQTYSLSDDTDVNYLVHASRP